MQKTPMIPETHFEELSASLATLRTEATASADFLETCNDSRVATKRHKADIADKLSRVLKTCPEALEMFLEVALND